ncbi:YcxB family protein [Streptomyces anulatus]|uniref:YcxB family protein n=1 Tax=Streptomyces anulatus TaxID=1892 RepID=UPI00255C2D59|nr:YcxB family protein [Streptomyces anulatus]WIY77250.1 YcxB family protein [Streptomyces anulatus]
METRGGDTFAAGTDRVAGVEFVYRPTVGDFEEALRAWALRTGAGRFQVFAVPVASFGALAVFGVVVGLSAPVLIVALVVCAAVVSWGALRALRTQARRMFSIVEPYGQCRMVADERGAVSTGERVSFTVEWAVHREYLETARLFVLFGGERSVGIAVLPKRGAQGPEDVERLRAILGRNLRQL